MQPLLRLCLADADTDRRARFRDGARSLGSFSCVAEVNTRRALAEALRDERSDVVVVNAALLTRDDELWRRHTTLRQAPALLVLTDEPGDALRAFGAGAVDCVLLPVDAERCGLALTRARAHVFRARTIDAVTGLVTALHDYEQCRAENGISYESHLRLTKGRRRFVVESAQIEWIQAEDCYCRVHMDDGSYLTRRTLADFERRLDPARFIRPHRTAMVNVSSVSSVDLDTGGGRMLVLRSGVRIPVSQRRCAQVAARMGERWIPAHAGA
jgi:two-component system LytT family response regulator